MRTIRKCKRIINGAGCEWWYSHTKFGGDTIQQHQIKIIKWSPTIFLLPNLVFEKGGLSKRDVFLAAADFCERMKGEDDA